MSDLKLALSKIQQSLNAPKNQYNKFGKYPYRSCEDILEGLKKVLGECVVTISDDIVAVGNRIYVKAVATISLGSESESVTAFAREEESQKGMAAAQLTGSTSSYARKYALNGLFLIDDNKDADSNESKTQADNAPKVDIAKVAKECGWTVKQVLESFNPPLKTLADIEDPAGCVAYLKSNVVSKS